MKDLGERMVPGRSPSFVEREHWARYEYAGKFAVGKQVADVACGSGYGAKLLREAGADSVLGVDLDQEAIAYATQNHSDIGIEFVVGSAAALITVPDETMDLVVSFETIEHLDDVPAYLKEMRRVLRPGGAFLLSTPDRRLASVLHPFLRRPQNRFHLREFTKAELLDVLSKQFTLVECLGQSFISHVFVFWPVQFALKTLSKILPRMGLGLKERIYENPCLPTVFPCAGKRGVPKYWVIRCSKPG